MSDEIREQLSALVDDELSDAERPLLLGRLERDAGLRDCLGRYQLISQVMRGTGQTETLGVADRVQQALADDAPVSMPSTGVANQPVWWKPLAGLASCSDIRTCCCGPRMVLVVPPSGGMLRQNTWQFSSA